MDPDRDDGDVVIRCQQNPGVSVRLYDAYEPDWATAGFSVQVEAPGLCARLEAVEVWAMDDEDLPAFIAGLAADFRGWTGDREWQSPRASVVARFHTGGHVSLTWTLRPATIETIWVMSVTTWVEAGEQMTNLANDLAHLLPRTARRSTPPPCQPTSSASPEQTRRPRRPWRRDT